MKLGRNATELLVGKGLAHRAFEPGRRGLVVALRVAPAAEQRRVARRQRDRGHDRRHRPEAHEVHQQRADREPDERAADAEEQLERGHRHPVLVRLRDVREQRFQGRAGEIAGQPEDLEDHDQPDQVGQALAALGRDEQRREQQRPTTESRAGSRGCAAPSASSCDRSGNRRPGRRSTRRCARRSAAGRAPRAAASWSGIEKRPRSRSGSPIAGIRVTASSSPEGGA